MDASQTTNTPPQVPIEQIEASLRLFNWGKTANRHIFGPDLQTDDAVFVAREEHEARLFQSLEALHTELERSIGGEPGQQLEAGTASEAYKHVAARAVLRKGVTWADIQQMRRSRSVYLGRKVGNSYMTAIRQPEPMPQVEIISLADEVLLGKDHATIRFSGQERTYQLDHPIAARMVELADSLKALGVNPAQLSVAAHGQIPVLRDKERDRATPTPEQTSSQPPADQHPSDDSASSQSIDDEPGAFEQAAQHQVSGDSTNVNVVNVAAASGHSAPPTNPVAAAANNSQPGIGVTAGVGKLEVLKHPCVRVNGIIYNLSDVAHQALREMARYARNIDVTAASVTPTGLDIVTLSVDSTPVELRELCAQVTDAAGVPDAPKSMQPSLASERIRSMLEAIKTKQPVAAVTPEELGRAPEEAASPAVHATPDAGDQAAKPKDGNDLLADWGDGREVTRPQIKFSDGPSV